MLISLSDSIKRRRKELKLSQTYVGDLAGVSLNTISKIERGEANPTMDIIEKIADVLGLELKLKIKSINNRNDEGSKDISE